MQLSNHVVKAYGRGSPRGPAGRLGLRDRDPAARHPRLRDLPRDQAHPDQLTDTDLGMANMILTNGARLYVDHAHPEYSGPEVTDALDAVRYDKAGDVVMAIAARAAPASRSAGPSGSTRTTPTARAPRTAPTRTTCWTARTPFDRVVTQFTGFLVSRQVITGAGRVGIGQTSQQAGFQLSQRADFFEAEVGLETTLNRPIINTRDEPHADASRHRRLHVITGDANLSEISTYLKVGTAVLGAAGDRGRRAGRRTSGSTRPVAAMRAVSHDLELRRPAHPGRRPADDRASTSRRPTSRRAAATSSASPASLPERGGHRGQGRLRPAGRTCWTRCARRPVRAGRPARLGGEAEADGVLPRARRAAAGTPPKLALIDLQYADVDPRRSLYAALVAKGKMQRLVTDDEIEAARTDAAEGHPGLLPRPGDGASSATSVVAASWDSVIFDVPGRPALQRVPLLDPLRGTREQVGQMLDCCADVTELFAALGR